MTQTVRITDIHPDDLFYKNRKDIIGSIVQLDTDQEDIIKGWKSTKPDYSVMSTDKKNYSGMCFRAIQYEVIE